jgi:hypothetical protein
MPTGTLTLALLALSTSAVPSDVVPMNSRNFSIPIRVAEGQRSKIKELILFASSDEGATWNQVSTAPPDKEAFIFYAPGDGLYWFNICVVDAQGHREPPDIYRSAPRQKVLVDTLSPNVRIVRAERIGDEVEIAWEIQEDHADLASFKLEQRTSDAPGWMWTAVNVAPSLNGQTRFRVATVGPVLVHLQISDQSGNVGEAQTEVRPKAVSPYGATASAPMHTNGLTQPTTSTPAPLPSNNWATPPAAYTAPAPVAQSTRSAASGSGTGWDSAAAAQSANLRRNDVPASPDRSWPPNGAAGNPQARGYNPEPANRIQPGVVNAAYSSSAAVSPRGPADSIPLELTNSAQTTIDYEVTRSGPSGVGKVELYLTQDEGRTWQHYTEDLQPRAGSPLAVTLPGEGIYGLRLVVTSGAGLAKRPPQPGDLPQMRIEVDTTAPLVKLYPPQPDPTRRDALLITWNASDRNLGANPITLQFAERTNGTWQTIAKELPNTGRYQWLMPPGVPYRVFLRVLASDAAGNLGVDQTPEQVVIDMNEPEVTIKRVNRPVLRQ